MGQPFVCVWAAQGIDRKRLAKLSVECYLEQVRGSNSGSHCTVSYLYTATTLQTPMHSLMDPL